MLAILLQSFAYLSNVLSCFINKTAAVLPQLTAFNLEGQSTNQTLLGLSPLSILTRADGSWSPTPSGGAQTQRKKR